MDTIMGAQENGALARSLLDRYNNRQSDPAWLDKNLTAFAADAEYIDVPSGAILRGPDGYKRLMRFFIQSFPDMRAELTDVFATEDRVALEGIWRWTDTGPVYLPSGALPMRRAGKLRCCFVLQIKKGKVVSLHCYYDMLTQMEQLSLGPAWE
ncbi:MAG TPA: ester cyclase [Ktedonobacteraceae bacterium]